MNPTDQEKFRPVIQLRLDAIAAGLSAAQESTKPISPDVAIGRLSRLDSMQMQQMALAGKRRLEDEYARLHEAMRRIDTGNYGRCLLCGGDIATERLEFQPDAVSCVACLNRRQ